MKELVSRFCPKCNNPMEMIRSVRGIPFYIVPRAQSPPYARKAIGVDTVGGGVPVDLYVCPKCKYVEMYALGREQAEALIS
jgi:hypothetical protein